MELQNNQPGVNVKLLYLSNSEMLAYGIITGVIAYVTYEIGKERQRRWLEKMYKKTQGR